jgi:hypothetical protein
LTREAVCADCPLCAHPAGAVYFEDQARRYFRCDRCALIHLDAGQLPTHAEEAERYRLHDNRSDDPDYVEFLRRLGDPVCDVVPVGARGLDFGCEPVPVLGEFLIARGRPTAAYDPLFFPDETVLSTQYDFVTCSEVVEHAHDPGALFARLGSLVRAGGTIGVMTRLYDPVPAFADWWYRRDLTHVCFYHTDTMRWIAGHHGWTLKLPVPNVAVFTTAA